MSNLTMLFDIFVSIFLTNGSTKILKRHPESSTQSWIFGSFSFPRFQYHLGHTCVRSNNASTDGGQVLGHIRFLKWLSSWNWAVFVWYLTLSLQGCKNDDFGRGWGGIQRPLLKSFISVHLDYFQVANMVYFICTQWCGGQIWSKVLLWVPTLKIILCPSKYVWGVPKKFWAQSDHANKAAPGFCVLMNLPSKKG